jgi:STE24 endopeptidase
MILWSLLVAAIVTWLIVRSGVLDRIEAKLGDKWKNLRAFVVALVFFIVSAILTLPWSIYADWWRERGYGRTSQPFSDWLLQLGIATAVTALLGAIFLMFVYWLIRRSGKGWWIWASVLTAVAFAFLSLMSPVLIEP